jgi:hypothetical protein
MRRNEENERLAKQEEIWNKENRLTKEEQVRSWTNTIEALEKIYKHFYIQTPAISVTLQVKFS